VQVTANVAFGPTTTIEAVESTKILLSHVQELKKGSSKDTYLLDASTVEMREAWIISFRRVALPPNSFWYD
jgi:hypothetical protein